MKSLFRRRTLLAALAGLFLLHVVYLYVKVGTGLARNAWDVPSILYGRITSYNVCYTKLLRSGTPSAS